MDVSRITPNLRPIAPPAPRPVTPASGPSAATRASGSTLWDLLTPDEQEFFTRQSALGPLTYDASSGGPPGSSADRAPLGGRIDARG